MTREDLIKHWDVIEAFKNGESVEVYDFALKDWTTLDYPNFYRHHVYRVKPKPEYRVKPEYVPFDFSDAQQLLGKIVIAKNEDFVGIISAVAQNAVYIGGCIELYKRLMEDFTFADGTPCGKIKTK